jgi:hypothetical protein
MKEDSRMEKTWRICPLNYKKWTCINSNPSPYRVSSSLIYASQISEAEQIMNDEIRPAGNNNNKNTGTKSGSSRRARPTAGGSAVVSRDPGPADPALLQRMEMLEAKMDTILLKLDIWAGKQAEKKHE